MKQQIILYDTEYTAWEGSQERRWSEPWEHREIIQIAALRLGLSDGMAVEASFGRFVRPEQNPVLSEYITRLTGISQVDVDTQGVLFPAALREFYRFCGEGQLALFSWGDDPGVLRENCSLCGVPFPEFPRGLHDIRDVMEAARIDTACYTSGTVWQALGLQLNLAAHDASNDVHNLLAALRELVRQGRVTHQDLVR